MGFAIDRGEAPSASMTVSWRHDRAVDELIGVCRGILADGALNSTEAGFLLHWLERHREFADSFPFNVLYPRVHDALADGVLDMDEERDLLEALLSVVGGEAQEVGGSNSLSTELPFDHPCPALRYVGYGFVLTGTFEFGKRSAVKFEIESRGGIVLAAVTGKTNYVIVGEVGSRDWIHSSYGRKIQCAVELRERGGAIAIVAERTWSTSLLTGDAK